MRLVPATLTAALLLTATPTRARADGWSMPDMLRKASVYLDVELRNLALSAERWAISLGGVLGPQVTVPDLSVLTAEPVKGVESSGFGWRVDPINGDKRFHKGTDYKCDRGTPVYAAGSGVVVIAGKQHGYGNVIYIDHGGGLITRYAHLSHIGVTKGETVLADTLIGAVGATGRATGPHLHFEVRLDGRAVDPPLAMTVAETERTQPAEVARIAAMSLLPEAQKLSVDRHAPPPDMRHNRPERRGRQKRVVPTS